MVGLLESASAVLGTAGALGKSSDPSGPAVSGVTQTFQTGAMTTGLDRDTLILIGLVALAGYILFLRSGSHE